MTMLLQWRQPPPTILARWRGPDGTLAPTVAASSIGSVPTIIGPPGVQGPTGPTGPVADIIDGGTFN
jgi:hypothetical protein